jgi:hypothetical protein
MRSSSHSPDRILVTFDDDHAVANAGLIQPATLAEHLGLRQLFDEYAHLGAALGRANVGLKAMTLVHSALAGGDCSDDRATPDIREEPPVTCSEQGVTLTSWGVSSFVPKPLSA